MLSECESAIADKRESKDPFVGRILAGKGILRLAFTYGSGSLRMTEITSCVRGEYAYSRSRQFFPTPTSATIGTFSS
jgi:hypothetical protein